MLREKKGGRRKILIADDDEAIVDVLQIMLKDAGYAVITSTEGGTAHKIETNLPDLVLLDLWMSGEDGGEICKYLKTTERTKNIPVIMISATNDLEKTSKNVGADDFIPKPFQMTDLLSKIEKYIGKN